MQSKNEICVGAIDNFRYSQRIHKIASKLLFKLKFLRVCACAVDYRPRTFRFKDSTET